VFDFSKLSFANIQDYRLKFGDQIKDVFNVTVSVLSL